MKRKLGFLIVLLSLQSCGSSVEETDYPGTYVYETESGKEELEVLAVGMYRHRLIRDGKVSIEQNGGWQVDVAGGTKGITFSAFGLFLKNETESTAYWFVVPEKSWKAEILLCLDPEEGICFKKLK